MPFYNTTTIVVDIINGIEVVRVLFMYNNFPVNNV